MLKINAADNSYTVERMIRNKLYNGEYFCLANFLDKYVFVIGGYHDYDYEEFSLKNISRYEIANDRWEKMPELTQARSKASACSLGGNIYVIGGQTEAHRAINSIEKLSNPGLTRDKAYWKLIQTPDSFFPPRIIPIVVSLNANEIAIFGGLDQDNPKDLCDVVLFDIKTETCQKSITIGPFMFISKENQAAQISPNKFVALVYKQENFDIKDLLIQYIGGAESFSILKEFNDIERV